MRPIDADVLMEEVLKGTIISDDLYGMGIMAGVDSFAKKLKAAPALTLDDLRPKGRWEPNELEGDVWFHCSECGTEISTSWDYDCDEMWNYCPSCGANMRGYMSDGQRNQEG